ncbi:MAG: CsbD family protein [Bdellovibrionota bacterium]
MNPFQKKVSAEKNIAVGSAKEKVGELIGNPNLKEEGIRDQVKGNVQKAVESVKDAAKAALK